MSHVSRSLATVGHHNAMKKLPAILITCLIVLSLSACLRYTPSREELEEKYASKNGPQADIGGEVEFAAYEDALDARLKQLISDRSPLLRASPEAGYAVGPGDVLDVHVFGFGDLQTSSEVAPDGSLSLPLVGQANVLGKSIPQIQRELRGRYGRFIRSPNVDVALKTYQSNRVSVIGEVARPGTYPLRRPGQLITEFLSEAGGKTQNAGNRIILLPAPRILPHQGPSDGMGVPIHMASTSPEQAQVGVEVDLEQLIGQVDQPPILIPMLSGDTVVVPEAGMFEVDGEVNKPGSYRLSSRTSVIGAIAAAAGFTYSANVHEVEVIREIGGGRKAAITLDLEEIGLRGARDIRLRNGDLVRVPSEPGRFFRRQVVETLNGLFNGFSITQRN